MSSSSRPMASCWSGQPLLTHSITIAYAVFRAQNRASACRVSIILDDQTTLTVSRLVGERCHSKMTCRSGSCHLTVVSHHTCAGRLLHFYGLDTSIDQLR